MSLCWLSRLWDAEFHGWLLPSEQLLRPCFLKWKRKARVPLDVEWLEDRTLLAGSWQEVGPAAQHDKLNLHGNTGQDISGRVTALAVAQGNPNAPPVLFLGTPGGGVWKGDISNPNQLPTWVPVTDHIQIPSQIGSLDFTSGIGAGSSAIGAIAIDPINTQIVYVGTGEPFGGEDALYGTGILKSDDGGNSFRLVSTGPNDVFFKRAFSKIIVDPYNNNTIYGSLVESNALSTGLNDHNNGIYKSTDSGVTWAKVAGFVPGPNVTVQIGDKITVTDLEYTKSRYGTATLFAGVSSDPAMPLGAQNIGGIWESVNRGQTWTPLGAEPQGLGAGAPFGANILRVAFAKNYFQDDSDNPQLFAAVLRSNLVQGNPGDLVEVYQSNNRGLSWKRIFSHNNFVTQGGSNLAFGVSPRGRLYLAGTSEMLELVDEGGTTWKSRSNAAGNGNPPAAPHTDHHVFLATRDGRIYEGDDGGIWLYKPNNDPAQPGPWVDQNTTGLGTIQVYGVGQSGADPNTLIVGSQDNGYAFTNQAALGTPKERTYWGTIEGGDGTKVRWASDFSNVAYRFNNAAPTRLVNLPTPQNPKGDWSDKPILNDPQGNFIDAQGRQHHDQFYNRLAIYSFDANRVLVSGPWGVVWETTNGGNSWRHISPLDDNTVNPPTAKLAHTDVLSLAYGPKRYGSNGIDFFVFAGYANGRLFRTDNDGGPDGASTNWTQVNDPRWGGEPSHRYCRGHGASRRCFCDYWRLPGSASPGFASMAL